MDSEAHDARPMVAKCGAHARSSGRPCQAAAMRNGRCRFHGGKSTGPRTPEGLARSRRANWKHGGRSRAVVEQRREARRELRALIRLVRELEGRP
jgi:hypothetical protein